MFRFAVSLLLGAVGWWAVADVAEGAEKPNVLLIMADDVGCETLGCYGGTTYKTPNLDELAREGMRFRYCFSMPVCHPTRVCLLTGRYPARLGNPGWGTFPKAEEKNTFAHLMKQAGYATAIAGKWQLTLMKNDLDHPRRLGFDEWCLFGWHEGPRYYQPLLYQNGKIRDDVRDRYGPDVYCEFLIDFMERNRERPFVAFYSMALCHDVTDDLDEPVPYAPGKDHYDTYHEMLEAMDVRVGRVVAALDRLKLREKTVVLFTTDNGTSKSYIHAAADGKYIRKPVFSQRGDQLVRGGKGELTDAGTNVPLIASWPGTIRPGQVVDDLVDMSDFLPTLVELGDVALPEGGSLDGHSFAPRRRGQSGKGREWVYAERGKSRFWVRSQRWKLYNDGKLFDVAADSEEKSPLDPNTEPAEATAARKQFTPVVKRLTVQP